MTSFQLAWGLILKDLVYFFITSSILVFIGLVAFVYCAIKSLRERIIKRKNNVE